MISDGIDIAFCYRICIHQYLTHCLFHVLHILFFGFGGLQIKVGEIKAGASYVPAGLTAKQYAELRAKEAKKKQQNYERNVKKAGVFIDYTDWYMKRGTDTKQSWKKDVNLGHSMAKTKYDWSGLSDKKKYAGSK